MERRACSACGYAADVRVGPLECPQCREPTFVSKGLGEVAQAFREIIRDHGYTMDQVWLGEVPGEVMAEALSDCGLFEDEDS